MPAPLILASGSETRRDMLQNAGLEIEVIKPRVDEGMMRDAMLADEANPARYCRCAGGDESTQDQ